MRVHSLLCSPHNHESVSSLARSGSLGWRAPRALALSLSLVAELSGCASTYQWVKDGFSPPLAEAKLASCQLDAERLRYFSAESDEDRADRIRHEAHLCMKADGWRLVQSDSDGASEKESDGPGKAASQTSSEEESASSSEQSEDKSSDKKEGKEDKKDDSKDDDSDDDSEE